MKICTLTNTYNSEEYLWYVLKSIYDWSDFLVIIDGAFNSRIPYPVSQDQTETIIKNFLDPKNKIRFERGAARSQIEQRQKAVKYLRGYDWLFLVDDDEIYKQEELRNLRAFLAKTKEDAFKIGGFTFFNSFEWYRWVADPRVWRVKPGMQFIGSNNLTGKDAKYLREEMEVVPSVRKYHYSYVRSVKRFHIRVRQTKMKVYPYKVDGKFFVRENVKFRHFEGEHPKIMAKHPYRKIKWNP